MASKLIAIVAGVGPGTGAAVARKFAATYPVVLLARNPDNYESLAKEINQSGGKAIGISTDISDSKSVKSAFATIEKEFGSGVGAAVSGPKTYQSLMESLMECLLIISSGSYIQRKWQICKKALLGVD